MTNEAPGLGAPFKASDRTQWRWLAFHLPQSLTQRSAGVLHGVIGAVVVVTVASPLLFTNRAFIGDFTNNIWLGWVRANELSSSIEPSYFISTIQTRVFDPIFAFYGGPLFTLLGLTDRLLGGQILLAFALFTTGGFALAYGGTYRCARLYGLSRSLAHLPALTVLTSAYYLSDL